MLSHTNILFCHTKWSVDMLLKTQNAVQLIQKVLLALFSTRAGVYINQNTKK